MVLTDNVAQNHETDSSERLNLERVIEAKHSRGSETSTVENLTPRTWSHFGGQNTNVANFPQVRAPHNRGTYILSYGKSYASAQPGTAYSVYNANHCIAYNTVKPTYPLFQFRHPHCHTLSSLSETQPIESVCFGHSRLRDVGSLT